MMIYRIAALLSALVCCACWGGEFRTDGGLFDEGGEAGSGGSDTATTTDSSGSTGESSSSTGKSSSGQNSASTSSSTSASSGTGGSGGQSGTEGDSGAAGAPAACDPPHDIPQGFVWEEFESTETPSCEGARATCVNSPCAELPIEHTAYLEPDELRIRITYKAMAKQTVEMDFSCGEEAQCYQEVYQDEPRVYYLDLVETDAGYRAVRFYRSDQDPDDDPFRLFIVQRSTTLQQPEYCGWFESPIADVWDEYVAWVLSLEWEC